ncbi:hypothetical protein WJX74_011053 [Apatococcus lobatus]|uniref:DUF3140 domain-containing protein n=2 Tax=Apatococcus TaxID=904362 RepID=A0AAW1T2Q8_9CHLO
MGGDDQVVKDFFHYVNMTAEELKEWLDNPTSMNTGQAAEDGEPKGHKSGKQILDILQKKGKDYSEDELTHMRHCNSYNKRHLSQGPSKDPEHSKWRYSLMNWGCDPLKKPIGKLDHSKVSEESQSKSKGKEESQSPQKTAEAKPSSPKKGSAKKEKEDDKQEEKPSSPQKRKSDKADDDDSKKQRTS